MKCFDNIRYLLTAVWDERRYILGVDNTGGTRPVQAKAQAEKESRDHTTSFDPELLTKMLQDPLFHLFFEMVFMLGRVPVELAQEAEFCPCHRTLVQGLSKHMRQLVFERLYGLGVTSCPLSGMGHAEYVATDAFPAKVEELFQTRIRDLYTGRS